MWRDLVEKRFFWATMEKEVEKLLYELIKAEEEEDGAIYLLTMHYDHANEELPFEPDEKKEILRLLTILIEESRKHQRLLQRTITRIEKESST